MVSTHFRSTVVSSTINTEVATNGSKKKNDFEDITHGGITKHCSLLFSKSPGRNHVDDVHKL